MTDFARLPVDDSRLAVSFALLDEPPEQLWYQGNLDLLDRRKIGIIGARVPSAYGLGVTLDAARELAAAGLVIVSGMARGLDSRAHQGALEVAGGTIAVLGCGIDVDYPTTNRPLRQRVNDHGLVLTEFPPGHMPANWTFPRRNRLIAALSEALLVVEAKIKSGTSNTVDWMTGIGRPVFAVPGRLGDPLSTGPNKMLRDGAHVYVHPNDILFELGLPPLPEADRKPRPPTHDSRPTLQGAEATLFDLIGRKPVQVDDLAKRSALEPGLLLAALSSLEMQGLVTQLPGKHFTLAT